MRRKKVTDKQKQEVLDLFKAGKRAKEVAQITKLSLSEVYKIKREAGAAEEMKTRAQADADDMRRHWDSLLPVLRDLEGIDVFPPRGYEIQTWLSRPEEPSWPVTKGHVCRDDKGRLSVKLFAEDQLDWEYLQQHLAGDQVWNAIANWKLAMTRDMAARRQLFDALLRQVESGINLPVLAEIRDDGAEGPCLHLYYVDTIYDQVISKVLGIRLAPKRREEFIVEQGKRIHLGGCLIAVTADATQPDAIISFLIGAQSKLVELPEAKAATEAYRQAERGTGEVKQALRRILLAPGLPPGSICDGCRSWVEALGAR